MNRRSTFIVFSFFVFIMEISFGQTKEFDIAGLKVIYKHVPKQTVTATFVIKGGTANYQKADEGIEALALQWASQGGTLNYPKDLLTKKLEKLGTEIESESQYDYSIISLTCLNRYWNESWDIFKDILLAPSFDKVQFQIIKNELISEAKYSEQTPEIKLKYLAMANVFKDSNYEKVPEGTPKALGRLIEQVVKEYYRSIIDRRNGFLVIVGDFEENALLSQLSSSLNDLPPGTERMTPETDIVTVGAHDIHFAKAETNYLRALIKAPKLDTQEGLFMLVAMNIMNERVFDLVRRKNGLSYNPNAFYATGVINSPYAVLQADTQDPSKVIELIIQIINEVRSQGFTEEELKSQKASFYTEHYLGQQSTSDQCMDLYLYELRGDWHISSQLLEQVDQISVENVNQIIREYTDIVRWTYLGDTDLINQNLFLTPK
jgi:zinc protease